MSKQEINPFEKYFKEYLKSTKKRKGEILNIVIELTEMNRKSVIRRFRRLQLKDKYASDGRGRPCIYTPDSISALKDVWNLSGELCAELLHPNVNIYIEELKEKDNWHNSEEATDKLLAMSLGTMKNKINNFIAEYKKGKGISTTKPSHIKFIVKVFTGPWKDKDIGYGQIDLVVHSGSSLSGDMAYTLNFTDVHFLWIGLRAQMGKGEKVTCESLDYIKENMLPFPMTGIHPDTGSEFINWHLKKWADKNNIEMTRSRAGKKNDNMLVEERNGHVARKIMGYMRISCPEAVEVLNELYYVECLIHNYFTPVRRTIEKVKIGAKYVRKFDKAQSPYLRILNSDKVDDNVKEQLRKIYRTLSLVDLKEKSAKLKKEVIEKQKIYGDRLW